MVELVDAGFGGVIVPRAGEFGAGPIGAWLFFRIHPWIEARRLQRHGAAARGFDRECRAGGRVA